MLSLSDVDNQFIKCIGYLHTTNNVNINEGDPIPLQNFLEEAIKNKTGVIKDLTNIVSSCLKQEIADEFKSSSTSGIGTSYEESKASNSDNELELDLLKEDLMCVVCNGMDVAARNRLLECSDCHALYHQECHRPAVVLEDSFSSWICQNCKVDSKKIKQTGTSESTSTEISGPTKSSKSSSGHRHSSTSSSSSYKSTSSTSSSKSSDKYKSSSPSSSSKSSSSSSTPTTTSSSTRSGLSPNINIISADKRIQNMKKKAAKLQEKRKQLR